MKDNKIYQRLQITNLKLLFQWNPQTAKIWIFCNSKSVDDEQIIKTIKCA